MGSYMTAVAVAICVVLGLFFALEKTASRPLFAQEFRNTPAHELIEMAQDAENKNRFKAIRQLARRPMSLDSIVPVLARLSMDPNPQIVIAAENSLNEIGDAGAEMLKPLFAQKTKSDTLLACSAAQAIGSSCKIYIPEFKDLLESGDRVERRAALYALKGMGEPGAELMDEVIDCLSDKDFNVRCMACRVLETHGPKSAKAEPELLRLLDQGGPSVRGWAAICLAAIGPELKQEDAIDLIAQKLKGDGIRPVLPVEHERYLAALVKFGSKSEKHLDTIRKGLGHHSVVVQSYSTFAILQISGDTEEAIKLFDKLVKDDLGAPQALELVGQIGEKASPFVPAVERCLSSDSPATRQTAVVALMKIGDKDPRIIKKIELKLNDPDPDVQMAARNALDILKEPTDE